MNAKKPTTADEIEAFARSMALQCRTHAEWLVLMRYGLGFLVDNQPLLVELISGEAARETDRQGAEGSTAANLKAVILDELGLCLRPKN